MSFAYGWGRDVFSWALAIQNLLWGAFQPFAGGVADRYGAVRVLWVGAIAYAAGLILMAHASTAGVLDLSAGVLVGFALSSCSFTIVIGAFGKLLPEAWRSLAFGSRHRGRIVRPVPLLATRARLLIDATGWQNTLVIFGGMMFLILPLALALATPSDRRAGKRRCGAPAAIGDSRRCRRPSATAATCCSSSASSPAASSSRFITVHLPAYLVDRGLSSANVGAWTIGFIGGAVQHCRLDAPVRSWLGNRMPKRYILSIIYFSRAAAVIAFILLPATPTSALVFGAVTGFLWLSTVPPTSGLVALMFGTRWLAMLFGFAFFSHQVGGFLGVLLGGYAYSLSHSYNPVWWLSVLFGVLSAVINLPIVEKPVARRTGPRRRDIEGFHTSGAG